jgi:endoglucanase
MHSLGVLALMMQAQSAPVSGIDHVAPINDRLILIHYKDGYVKHPSGGQKRAEGVVVQEPLDVVAATKASAYSISSKDDQGFSVDLSPSKVGRKSKGTDFAWFTDKWVDGRAVNDRPDHTKEHWLYLVLPKPLKVGSTYTVSTGFLAKNGKTWTFKFDPSTRSEAVHVNTLGYSPKSPAKFGYVYHWAGDLAGVNFKAYEGKPFYLMDATSGKNVFEGKVAFRKAFDNQETYHVSDSAPHGNFLKADVFDCDFSAFNEPGKYKLYVPGVGSSFPFEISANVYFPAYYHVARALYHNRSGIELKEPYTKFARPAPHHSQLTPGFKGKLKYTTSRWIDWTTGDSTAADRAAQEKAIKGDLDVSGWYQDAGDWDSYESHLRVAQELLFAIQVAPKNFTDKQLNIPESGNGVPDLLDEAMWLPRFCQKLRAQIKQRGYGTGGLGLRVCGDQFGEDGDGVPSWKDVNRIWIASGEDPVSTLRYSGTAGHLALVLRQLGLKDPQGVDWQKEALETYNWSMQNMRTGDEEKVRTNRIYAAAALYRLTGEMKYEAQMLKDSSDLNEGSFLVTERLYGPMLYAILAEGNTSDAALLKNLKGAVLNTANQNGIVTASRRALRWAGDFSMPMLVGQQCNPICIEVPVAYKILAKSDPVKAKKLLEAMYTTADYFLGTNAENRTWITGVGARPVTQIFHLDAWYRGSFQPGLIPYSPWRKDKDFGNGPWDVMWPLKTIYPTKIEQWPGNEQYFNNRCSPMGNEFTVHQNIGPAAAYYGILIGEN